MIASVRRTETGIACARCSYWENRKRVVVHHATVADVRACSMQPHTPPTNSTSFETRFRTIDTMRHLAEERPMSADRLRSEADRLEHETNDVINAEWAVAKQAYAEQEATQERAAYEAEMEHDTEVLGPQGMTSWPSTREDVVSGRYALEVDGVTKFYKVDKPTEGRWAGYTFVNVQASDELYPVRNKVARDEILNLIAVDPKAAMLRYGKELGHCGHCGRTLTDETSRSLGIGPVCRGKLGW